MDITIREATEADLDRILLVYRDAGLDRRRSLTLEEAQTLFRKISSYPRYKLYVAEDGPDVVGTFALLIMDNLVNGGAPSGIVEDVAVARAAQRQGVGKKMMEYAREECRRHGCYKMLLSSNEIRAEAHRFYEALGFVRHGYSFRMELENGAQPGGAPPPTK
jgi:GNAT superfamily N-acetyltransferase